MRLIQFLLLPLFQDPLLELRPTDHIDILAAWVLLAESGSESGLAADQLGAGDLAKAELRQVRVGNIAQTTPYHDQRVLAQ